MTDGLRQRIQVDTIHEKLDKLIDEFAYLIDDYQLRKDFYDEVYIAGGCIYSLVNHNEYKDIDMFFRNESTTQRIRDYFYERSRIHQSHTENVKIGIFEGYHMVFTDNAVSVGDFQIITRWTGSPEEVVGQFDFKHNMFFYEKGQFYGLVDSSHLYSEYLSYNGERARDICGTIIRIQKFTERGMKIRRKEVARMLLHLEDVGFNDRELDILHSFDRNSDGFES